MRLRLVFLAAAGLGLLFAQSGIGPPLAGYARDTEGALRPVYGVFGNFVAGEPIARGVRAAYFSGRTGLAWAVRGIYSFDASGNPLERIRAPRRWMPRPALTTEGEELVFRLPGGAELRRQVEGEILGIEQIGENLFQIHQAGRRLAVRAAEDRLEICTLPERFP